MPALSTGGVVAATPREFYIDVETVVPDAEFGLSSVAFYKAHIVLHDGTTVQLDDEASKSIVAQTLIDEINRGFLQWVRKPRLTVVEIDQTEYALIAMGKMKATVVRLGQRRVHNSRGRGVEFAEGDTLVLAETRYSNSTCATERTGRSAAYLVTDATELAMGKGWVLLSLEAKRS